MTTLMARTAPQAPPPPLGPDQDQSLARAQWPLAHALSATGRMRVSRDGGRRYPARTEQPLSAWPPNQPATILVYDPATGTGHLLACDFDIGRAAAGGAADPAAAVAGDAAAFAALIARCGGRSICDISPSGGRHVYVLWDRPQPLAELKQLALALARRYPTLDPAPMSGANGLIRPPGSRYKLVGGRSPGWQRLTTPLEEARAAAADRCGLTVWNCLIGELAAELTDVTAYAAPASTPPGGGLADEDDNPWLPRPQRLPIRPDLERIAVTGSYPARYRSRSEARQAILSSAAARGWRLTEVISAMGSQWPGLDSFYRKYRPATRAKVIRREWKKAVTKVAPQKSALNSHTRQDPSCPPGLCGPTGQILDLDDLNVHQWIWTWRNAVWLAERDSDRVQEWGRAAVSVRLALRAIAAAAQMVQSTEIEFGCRDLALHAKISSRALASALALLRAQDDPLLVRVKDGRGLRGDRYRLRIPGKYRADALWRRWRAGRIEPVHQAFRVLGGAAMFTYEALGGTPAAVAEIARLAVLGTATVRKALEELAEHGLAERDSGGWRAGPADLDGAAARTGAGLIEEEIRLAYRRQRDAWRKRLVFRPPPGTPAAALAPAGPADAAAARGSLPAAVTGPRAPPEEDALRLIERVLGGRILASA